jgi:hypothetical protein
MVKAVVSGGEIRVLEPLPPEWRDGDTVYVELLEDNMTPEEIDREFDLLDELCASSDPADEERMRLALEEAHQLAKEQVRKQMGLQ